MLRLCLLLCMFVSSAGCASDGDKSQWDEVWKDLRGENMKMRSNIPVSQ
jgi:hypothetical protein